MKKKTLKERFDSQVVLLLIYLVLVVTIVSSLFGLLNKEDKTVFGYTARIVVSGSMEPEIMTNSLNIIKKCNIEDINSGDIVCYRYSKDIIHRVVDVVTNEDGTIVLHTKGDANEFPDSIEIHEDMVLGKVVHTFNGLAPYIEKYSITPGNIDTVALSKHIVINCVIIGVLIFIAVWAIQWVFVFIKSINSDKKDISRYIDKYIRDIDELIMYRDILKDIRDNNVENDPDTRFEFIMSRIAQTKVDVSMYELHSNIKNFKADIRKSLFLIKLGKLMDMNTKDKKLSDMLQEEETV